MEMKLEIEFDIVGDNYKAMIDLLGTLSAKCGFVIRENAPLSPGGAAVVDRFRRLGAVSKLVTEWPGTVLTCGSNVRLFEIEMNRAVCEALKEASNSLFSWQQPDLPEDLFFYDAHGNVLFSTTAHEGYARVDFDGEDEMAVLLNNVLLGAKVSSGQLGGILVGEPAEAWNCGYVGLEGTFWQVPGVDFGWSLKRGRLSLKELDAAIDYFSRARALHPQGRIVCLALGESRPDTRFRFVGYDCGFYNNEYDNYSAILDCQMNPEKGNLRNGCPAQLNEYGLFDNIDLAHAFARKFACRGCCSDQEVVVPCAIHLYKPLDMGLTKG